MFQLNLKEWEKMKNDKIILLKFKILLIILLYLFREFLFLFLINLFIY